MTKLTTIFKCRCDVIKSPTDKCSTELAHNLDFISYSADSFIRSSMTALGTSFTTSNVVPGNTAYNDIVNVLQDTYLHLRSVESAVTDYLGKLEALTSGQISADVYAAVQISPCV